MMLTNDAASTVGVTDRSDERQNILGGAKYLAQALAAIPKRIAEPDHTWFALAAYNAGFGHMEDARILAQMRGKNPDSWRDVREQLPLLAEEAWYSRLKRGYARGWSRHDSSIRCVSIWLCSNGATPQSDRWHGCMKLRRQCWKSRTEHDTHRVTSHDVRQRSPAAAQRIRRRARPRTRRRDDSALEFENIDRAAGAAGMRIEGSNTTRRTRACTSAAAHIGHGSSVT